MDIIRETKYVVGTKIGKPLYIVMTPSMVDKELRVKNKYYLTENLSEASKCINLKAAHALIEAFIEETGSIKDFEPKKIKVEFWLEDEDEIIEEGGGDE